MPIISVIIPIYNSEKYLDKCIQSVINQSVKNIEIICVNDGSTDSSSLIVQKYLTQDDRVKLINKPNGGLSSARNTGIGFSNGDYLMFVDADDELLYRSMRTERLNSLSGTSESVFGTATESSSLA